MAERRHDVMLPKSCQRIGLVKYYTLYGCVWGLFCRAEHDSCVRRLFWSIRRRNPPWNVEDNLRVGHLVIEAWFTGYWGSPGLRGPQMAGLLTWVGLLGYEDTRQKTSSRVRMGLSFAWMASLAFGYVDSFLYNWLCTTLVPSSVYINRRA